MLQNLYKLSLKCQSASYLLNGSGELTERCGRLVSIAIDTWPLLNTTNFRCGIEVSKTMVCCIVNHYSLHIARVNNSLLNYNIEKEVTL